MTDSNVDQTSAMLVIGIRSDVRRLTNHLDRALLFASKLDYILASALRLSRELPVDLARSFDLGLDIVFGLARGADRALDFARIIGFALDRALQVDRASASDLASIRGIDQIHIRDVNLARDYDLARDLARELARIRDMARSGNVDLDLARNLNRDLDLARGLFRSLDLDLHSNLDNVRDLACDLNTRPVDASDADLSCADIHGLDVLDGVIWTRETTWPPGVADAVRSRSREIRPGIYQVGRGNDLDRLVLASA